MKHVVYWLIVLLCFGSGTAIAEKHYTVVPHVILAQLYIYGQATGLSCQ
jgi:hypothetical protein